MLYIIYTTPTLLRLEKTPVSSQARCKREVYSRLRAGFRMRVDIDNKYTSYPSSYPITTHTRGSIYIIKLHTPQHNILKPIPTHGNTLTHTIDSNTIPVPRAVVERSEGE